MKVSELTKGAIIDNGYSSYEVMGESPLKGYALVIRAFPEFHHPYGSKKLWGRYYHVTEKVLQTDFKIIKSKLTTNGRNTTD